MKKKVVGDGITAREVVFYETPEEQYSYLKKHFSGRTFDFENLILKRIEKIAWNELESAKYTRGKLLKQIPLINAGHIDPEHEEFDVIRAALSLTRNKPDSKEGYAAEWLNTIHFIRTLREKDPDISLRMTFELGQSFGVAVMKFKWERRAMSGHKRAEDLRHATAAYNKTRSEKAAKLHKEWCQAARAKWAKLPTLGAPSVARMIAAPDENPNYIRQIISHLRPPKK